MEIGGAEGEGGAGIAEGGEGLGNFVADDAGEGEGDGDGGEEDQNDQDRQEAEEAGFEWSRMHGFINIISDRRGAGMLEKGGWGDC